MENLIDFKGSFLLTMLNLAIKYMIKLFLIIYFLKVLLNNMTDRKKYDIMIYRKVLILIIEGVLWIKNVV